MSPASPPVLSVVMPVRNGAAYLEAAVRSVLEQTFRDFEFIIIDDGSTDRTASMLAAFAAADARIRLLQTVGGGIVSALNLGVRAARGKLIARMDSDDIALPERFAVQMQALHEAPALAAVGSTAITIDSKGKVVGRMRVPTGVAPAMEGLLKTNVFLHPTMLFRREPMMAAGLYRPCCIYAEDYDLWLRLSEIGQMANLHEPLLHFRLHPGQTSKTKRMTQKAATALARQLALRRRAGKPEGMDTELPLRSALMVFLRQVAESRAIPEHSDAADIRHMMRAARRDLDSSLAKSLFLLLRSRETVVRIGMFRFRLAVDALLAACGMRPNT